MQIVVYAQIAKNVTINRSCKDLKEIVVGGKQFRIHTMMKDLEKTFVLLETNALMLMKKIQHLLIKDIIAQDPISLKQRLVVCLYRFGKSDYIHTGLGSSTVCNIVTEVF